MKRKVLRLSDKSLSQDNGLSQENSLSIDIETGRMWRRARSLNLQECSLELVQMAGMWALIVHRGGREYPLLTWAGRAQVEAAMVFLDQVAPAGQWPRRLREKPTWDR